MCCGPRGRKELDMPEEQQQAQDKCARAPALLFGHRHWDLCSLGGGFPGVNGSEMSREVTRVRGSPRLGGRGPPPRLTPCTPLDRTRALSLENHSVSRGGSAVALQ